MQRIMGKGKVLLSAAAPAVQRTLLRGETLKVAVPHLAAYQFGMPITWTGLRGLGAVLVWGQGVATLTGPGTVWIEAGGSSSSWRAGGLLEK